VILFIDNVGPYITPAFPSNKFNFLTKPTILQKPLFYSVCSVTTVSQFICVNIGVNSIVPYLYKCFCYSVGKNKCLKKKIIKGGKTRCCLDARKKPQGNIQEMKSKGENDEKNHSVFRVSLRRWTGQTSSGLNE